MTAAPAMSLPAWLADSDAFATKLEQAGWQAIGDAQWTGAEHLRAEIVGLLSDTYPQAMKERAQLKRDAERYWWLNDSPHSFGILRAMSTGDLTGPMVDDAIDAAMQAAQ